MRTWKRWLAAALIGVASFGITACDDTEFDFPTPEFGD